MSGAFTALQRLNSSTDALQVHTRELSLQDAKFISAHIQSISLCPGYQANAPYITVHILIIAVFPV